MELPEGYVLLKEGKSFGMSGKPLTFAKSIHVFRREENGVSTLCGTRTGFWLYKINMPIDELENICKRCLNKVKKLQDK